MACPNCEPSHLNHFVARLTAVACSLLTPRWRWALALCRNAIQPGHTEQRAVGPRWPEEPHATQRDLHHAPPAQSQASATRRMVARLSPTRSRSSNLKRRASLLDERLLVGENRATIRLVADACDCAGGAW
eukprot:scaffold40876_cov72-Phaeocystis_antarctica.AAC.1